MADDLPEVLKTLAKLVKAYRRIADVFSTRPLSTHIPFSINAFLRLVIPPKIRSAESVNGNVIYVFGCDLRFAGITRVNTR